MKSTTFLGISILVIPVARVLAGWTYEGQWGSEGYGNGQFYHPEDVAVAASGNVYVADAYNHRVQYFTSSGSFLGKWGTEGSGAGQFGLARGLAFASSGNIYVTDYRNGRVQYFTPTGSYLGFHGSEGTGDGGKCTFKDLWIGFNDGKLTATKHNYKPAWLDNVTIGEE
jgi:DNA-binding beta-propeller fold protein YncE